MRKSAGAFLKHTELRFLVGFRSPLIAKSSHVQDFGIAIDLRNAPKHFSSVSEAHLAHTEAFFAHALSL